MEAMGEELQRRSRRDWAGARTVTVWRITYEPTDDGDRNVLSEQHDDIDCDRPLDDLDRENGITNAADVAVDHIRNILYIRGQYAASSHPGWGGPGTWFMQEPYDHPAMNQVEETTAHLNGPWTDAERHAIWERVTAE